MLFDIFFVIIGFLLLVKGGDYKVEQIAGHKQVLQNGGKVIIIPFVDGCSTTNIVKKIQSQAK